MDLEIHYDGEWAALYGDGKLITVGDADVAEEEALELCGVTIVRDNAFMRGQDHRDGVAQTLEEVAEYSDQRAARLADAAAKFAEAERLYAEARALGHKG